jgi:uncharacterized protein (DUF2141 family)
MKPIRGLLSLGSTLALVSVVGPGTSRAHGDTEPKDVTSGVLSVRLVELRNNNGQTGCGLWPSERGFPKDRTAAIQTKWCRIANRESLCAFDPIASGTYAVACFHDENNNRLLDTGLFGIPTEGLVASRSAKGFMGPPKFDDAKFWFAGKAAELRLRMGY